MLRVLFTVGCCLVLLGGALVWCFCLHGGVLWLVVPPLFALLRVFFERGGAPKGDYFEVRALGFGLCPDLRPHSVLCVWLFKPRAYSLTLAQDHAPFGELLL